MVIIWARGICLIYMPKPEGRRPEGNDESLEWLKFGGFGELIKFTKVSSANSL